MSVTPTIVWFRRDLRLQDNPALAAAVERGGPVIPVFIHDEPGGPWSMGGASRWWLHHSLAALDASLGERGSRLVLAQGDNESVLSELTQATGAGALYWNRQYGLPELLRENWLETTWAERGLDVRSFNGGLLHEPETIANKQGGPFQVFTPYWRTCLTLSVEPPLTLRTKRLLAPRSWPASIPLREFALLPRIRWDAGFSPVWEPGEASALRRLRQFAGPAMTDYEVGRNRMPDDGTSRLSPHLHFGEISPRQVWAEVRRVGRSSGVFPPNKGASVFLNEIGWREFSHYLLYHFPHTPELPLRDEFRRFPWAADPGGRRLRAWEQGQTGYPIVDAAMRQLWSTGWMHNRARMVVASFLVKHLRLPWQAGAQWFWDTLVDADLANNTLGWQWSAGCGADAAPYFRIFAPVVQGRKFDPEGEYVRRWVPELARLPVKYIHAPWTATTAELAQAGVRLGENYPRPLVDHATARRDALAAFKQFRSRTKSGEIDGVESP